MRITKVTTKIGDKGTTRLGTNEIVSKSSLEIHVLGDLDELSSVLGMVKVAGQTEELKSNIENIQNKISMGNTNIFDPWNISTMKHPWKTPIYLTHGKYPQ